METLPFLAPEIAVPGVLLSVVLLLLSLALRSPGAAVLGAVAAGTALLARGWMAAREAPERALYIAWADLLPVLVLTLVSLTMVGRPRTEPTSPGRRRAAALGGGLFALLAVAWLAEPRAEPGATDSTPWFLSGLEALSAFVPSWYAWGVLPFAITVALLLWPRLDPDGDPAGRESQGRRVFVLGWIALGVLPLWLGVLRLAENAQSPLWPLSTQVWERWTGIGAPASWGLRELPGLLFLGFYFVGLPVLLQRSRWTRGIFARYRDELRGWRYWGAIFLLLVILLPLVKIYLRWLLGIEVIVESRQGWFTL